MKMVYLIIGLELGILSAMALQEWQRSVTTSQITLTQNTRTQIP